jgi:transcriptional regulator with XRE-family HTH domain
MLVSQYAPRLRAARAYANLTQEELAEQLGVDSQTIKRRESGKQEPKKAERIAVATITGVPLAFIENGWEGVTAQPDDERIRQAAALLGPALIEAARAVGQAQGGAPGLPGALDRQPEDPAAGAA